MAVKAALAMTMMAKTTLFGEISMLRSRLKMIRQFVTRVYAGQLQWQSRTGELQLE